MGTTWPDVALSLVAWTIWGPQAAHRGQAEATVPALGDRGLEPVQVAGTAIDQLAVEGEQGIRPPVRGTVAVLQFETPFNKLIDRNNFRQVIIDYQRDRRQLIQFEDAVYQSIRQQIRDLEELKTNLEIQRRAVVIAIRRGDQTREGLSQPPPAPQPGQPVTPLGPTAALNLLTALNDLQSSLNNFMSVWLNYYAARMRLSRDLGVMELDDRGMWIEKSILQNQESTDNRTAKSPLFASVTAARPSCNPVRRDVLSTSGVFLSITSI